MSKAEASPSEKAAGKTLHLGEGTKPPRQDWWQCVRYKFSSYTSHYQNVPDECHVSYTCISLISQISSRWRCTLSRIAARVTSTPEEDGANKDDGRDA